MAMVNAENTYAQRSHTTSYHVIRFSMNTLNMVPVGVWALPVACLDSRVELLWPVGNIGLMHNEFTGGLQSL